ncbi:MAG: hypothetical protein EOO28_06800 [Comamonadaceae bacterium]|nr:MAG: hypothetical protein EOO28_06800 [Comamonadaceae bacterium]
MTSFAYTPYSTQHSGINRVESAVDAVGQLGHGFSGARGLATALLSAMVAAVMVVAYQVMDSVVEGHLLVGWLALWAIAFATLAVFAGSARRLAARIKVGLDSWSQGIAEARADQRLWAMARADARVMSDLQAAMSRQETLDVMTPAHVVAAKKAERVLRSSGGSMLRAYQSSYL